ncbi:MAG TPA: hypothetical protein VF806_09425 [Anaerolineaceae bacterium]
MANAPKHMVQAYRQAPWRIQTQRGVILLIVAILGASVLWVMVSVTIQAAAAGLQVQQYESDQEDLQRQIADLRTQIGVLTSASQMEKRAEALGFTTIKPEDVTYMVIPGYTGRAPDIKAPPPGSTLPEPLVKPAYTQSLWEWLQQGVLSISAQPGGISP